MGEEGIARQIKLCKEGRQCCGAGGPVDAGSKDRILALELGLWTEYLQAGLSSPARQ